MGCSGWDSPLPAPQVGFPAPWEDPFPSSGKEQIFGMGSRMEKGDPGWINAGKAPHCCTPPSSDTSEPKPPPDPALHPIYHPTQGTAPQNSPHSPFSPPLMGQRIPLSPYGGGLPLISGKRSLSAPSKPCAEGVPKIPHHTEAAPPSPPSLRGGVSPLPPATLVSKRIPKAAPQRRAGVPQLHPQTL